MVSPLIVDRERRKTTAKLVQVRGFLVTSNCFCASDCGAQSMSVLQLYEGELRPARIVVISARRDDYLSAFLLSSLLLGEVILAGVTLVDDAGRPVGTIHSCDTISAASAALLVFDSTTTVKINNVTPPTPVRAPSSEVPVGLDRQVQRIRGAMESGGARAWLLLQGKRGCGMSTAISYCREALNFVHVVNFSEMDDQTILPSLPHCCRSILVWIEDGDDCLSLREGNPLMVKLRKCIVESTIDKVCQRWGRTTDMTHTNIVICAASDTAVDDVSMIDFVDHTVGFAAPDADQRKKIILHRFPGVDGDALAQAAVGLSRSELLSRPLEDLNSSRRQTLLQWSRIAGLSDVKALLQHTILRPRLFPERYRQFGLQPPRGVLLYGPPGCAKTSLVKALCGDQNLGFVYLDGAELISAYIGESEQILRSTFATAAQKAPCVVFFDEVEIIGGCRSGNGDNARLLSTLLIELDGFSHSADVCFVGATNMPHMLDSALLRPGRFDQLVYVPLPDQDERYQMFQMFLGESSATVNFDVVSRASAGFSGADIEGVCRQVVGRLTATPLPAGEPLRARLLTTETVLEAINANPIVPYDAQGIDKFRATVAGQRSF